MRTGIPRKFADLTERKNSNFFSIDLFVSVFFGILYTILYTEIVFSSTCSMVSMDATNFYFLYTGNFLPLVKIFYFLNQIFNQIFCPRSIISMTTLAHCSVSSSTSRTRGNICHTSVLEPVYVSVQRYGMGTLENWPLPALRDLHDDGCLRTDPILAGHRHSVN